MCSSNEWCVAAFRNLFLEHVMKYVIHSWLAYGLHERVVQLFSHSFLGLNLQMQHYHNMSVLKQEMPTIAVFCRWEQLVFSYSRQCLHDVYSLVLCNIIFYWLLGAVAKTIFIRRTPKLLKTWLKGVIFFVSLFTQCFIMKQELLVFVVQLNPCLHCYYAMYLSIHSLVYSRTAPFALLEFCGFMVKWIHIWTTLI